MNTYEEVVNGNISKAKELTKVKIKELGGSVKASIKVDYHGKSSTKHLETSLYDYYMNELCSAIRPNWNKTHKVTLEDVITEYTVTST